MKNKTILNMILAALLVPVFMGISGAIFYACADEEGSGSIEIQGYGQDVALEESNGTLRIVAVEKPKVEKQIAEGSRSIAYSPIVSIDNINVDYNGSESKGEIVISKPEEPVVIPVSEPAATTAPASKKEPKFETEPKTLKSGDQQSTANKALIQAPAAKPGLGKYGSIPTPVVIELKSLHFDKINDRAPIMRIEGIGTSIWTRGPPSGARETLSLTSREKISSEKMDLSLLKNGNPYSVTGIFSFFSAGGLVK